MEIGHNAPFGYWRLVKRIPWLRLVGLVLLAALLWWIDLGKLAQVFRTANLSLVALAVAANLLLILLKTFRWQALMRPQDIHYNTSRAYLSYWGSIFIGFFTPGRVGEFVKATHVSQDCQVSWGRAFSSVLVDRLFDLYALLLVGAAALLALHESTGQIAIVLGSMAILTAPLGLFLTDRFFAPLQGLVIQLENRLWRENGFLSKIFAEGGWLMELRQSLRQLTWPWLLWATFLTGLAYAVFFSQCYLLALALRLPVGFGAVLYSVALGSLVTLLPISISGLGTREATIIAYLGSAGTPPEAALSFSLLVFFTFYVAGGLIGAVAWWLKPVSLTRNTTVSKL